jgi:serine O-acetyltransferase
VIGNGVKIYQGVTLGAKSFPLDKLGNPIKGIKRHPDIGDGAVIYANATVLGAIKVGENACIAGNSWVTHDVPANATAR